MTLNFWKLLSGRIFSNVGDCFFNVSLIWLIYHITGNTFYTGITGFLVLTPMMLQFLAGPLIEKFDKKKLLIATEAGQIMTVIAAFSLYTTVWHHVLAFIVFTPVVAILSLFSNPAEMTLIPRFVASQKLSSANALMNITYQTLQIVFTALVGAMLIFFNPLHLYLFSVLFNVCSAACFFLIRMDPRVIRHEDSDKKTLKDMLSDYTRSLVSGFTSVRQSFISRFIPATMICNMLFGMLNAVLPAYAEGCGGAQWFGFYQSAETLGMLAGAALAPVLKNIPLGKLTAGSFFISGIVWLFSYFTGNTIISLALYAASFPAIGVTNILFVTAIQRAVPGDQLAQVYTIIISAGSCAMPLGSLAGGQIAYLWGVTPAFTGLGLSFLFLSIYWFSQKILRHMPPADQLGTGAYTISAKAE
ncbi:MFS transporter [Sporolactobacillus sp. THM19-2]|uniref:MFS transporter n=1 Tax=Sporolactobacillus sp. THM19-2 TaxID=2511171 RepID=UPI001020772D|nr:MFS transporter [Sporolactobacillus sp. THM19-2]RYL92823.1 MFS transporter [Sporolactobacillus sp. THM19-2]